MPARSANNHDCDVIVCHKNKRGAQLSNKDAKEPRRKGHQLRRRHRSRSCQSRHQSCGEQQSKTRSPGSRSRAQQQNRNQKRRNRSHGRRYERREPSSQDIHCLSESRSRRSNHKIGPISTKSAKPHRSARAAKRSCLANNSCQLAVDLPVVSRGINGKWDRRQKWVSKKPHVSKPSKLGSDGYDLEDSLSDFEDNGDLHFEDRRDLHFLSVQDCHTSDCMEEVKKDRSKMSALLDHTSRLSAPASLAKAIIALAPPHLYIGKQISNLGRWFGKSAECIRTHSECIPMLVDTVHRVYKLDETSCPVQVPSDLRIDLACLLSRGPTIETKLLPGRTDACLELMLRLEDEQRRRAFAHEALAANAVQLFGPDGLPALDVRYRPLTQQETACAKIPALPPKARGSLPNRENGSPAFVHTLQAFKDNLFSFSQNLLRNLDLGPDRLVVGGSSTMVCAMAFMPPSLLNHLRKRLGPALAKHVLDFVGEVPAWLDAESGCFAGADVDLFVLGSNLEEAQERFLKAAEQLYKNMCASSRHVKRENYDGSNQHVMMAQTGHTITFFGRYPLRHVQLVAYVAKNIDEMLAFVDLDCTAMVFDGSNVWAASRALRAHATGYNVVPPAWLRFLDPCGCSHVPSRVLKYSMRGFGTLVFQRCRHQPSCNSVLHGETAKMITAIKSLQTAPSEAVALVKESLRFKRRVSQDVDNMRQRDFYGSQAIFPGIPRGPTLLPEDVERMLSRQYKQAHQKTTAGIAPEPIYSVDMLQSRVTSIVQSRMNKCSAFIMDPLRCH